jgi:nitrogen fixation/metabolism regulation signal transduction histidine kinase
MRLRTKLVLAQVPLLLALVLVGTLARRTIHAVGERASGILKDNYRSLLYAQRMRKAADELGRIAYSYSLGEPVERRQLARADRAFERELDNQEHNITEPGEAEITARLRARWSEFQQRVRALQVTDSIQAARIYGRELLPALAAVADACDEVLAVNEDAMVRKTDRTFASAEKMDEVMLVATFLAFLGGLVSSALLTSRMVRPLAVLTQAVRRLGEGDLAARARLAGHDEIGEVAREVNLMADHLGQYRASSLGELIEAQQAAQATIDSLPDPVIVLSIGGDIENVNRAAEALFTLSIEHAAVSLAGTDPGVRAALTKMREHVRSGRGAYVPKGLEEAISLPTAEGPRFFLVRAAPVLDAEGNGVGLTVVFQDVTRLRHFDELKDDLVAKVAHELRAPLSSLSLAVHVCLEETTGPLTEKQADLLQAARDDCERLQSMVDDLLDLSRIQAGS